EPNPTDPGYVCVNETIARDALRSFYDTVGAEAKKVDPNHLFESGQQGVGQCGQQDQGCTTSSWTSCTSLDYEYVVQSSGVDVASYHDYGADSTAVPGYLAESIPQAAADGKPLVVGELGINAQTNLSGCMTLTDRANDIGAKLSSQLAAGVSGITVWDWIPGTMGTTCTTDIAAGDPILTILQLKGWAGISASADPVAFQSGLWRQPVQPPVSAKIADVVELRYQRGNAGAVVVETGIGSIDSIQRSQICVWRNEQVPHAALLRIRDDSWEVSIRSDDEL